MSTPLNSSFRDYVHPADHSEQTISTPPRFKSFAKLIVIEWLSPVSKVICVGFGSALQRSLISFKKACAIFTTQREKTNRDLLEHVFPHLAPFVCFEALIG